MPSKPWNFKAGKNLPYTHYIIALIILYLIWPKKKNKITMVVKETPGNLSGKKLC